MTDTLYVFIDESGNFDFSPKGTRHFVMSAVCTTRPEESAKQLASLKYELLSEGVDISSFHATNDFQFVRNRVFKRINSLRNSKAMVIFAVKERLSEDLRVPVTLLAFLAEKLLSIRTQDVVLKDFRRIVILFDRSLSNKQLNEIFILIKPYLKKIKSEFLVGFHSMHADMNSQVADYVSWSMFVLLERNERRPWETLQLGLRPKALNLLKL